MENNTSSFRIEFTDGQKFDLPDITYDLFTELIFKGGASDTEYLNYLQSKNMKEPTDFNNESTVDEMFLVYENEDGRILKFKCVYDSEKV